MSFVTLKAQINSKLNALKGAGHTLNFVYDEHRTQFEGYPTATFEPSDMTSDYETQGENLRNYVFLVIIYQEMEKTGGGESINVLAGAVDEIVNAFDNDYTLGGNCMLVKATPSRWGVMPTEHGLTRYAELKIECQVIYTLT
jgi:hypothetical protein